MNIKGLIKKELKAYFNSPMAYLVVLFFVLTLNIFFFFFGQFFGKDTASMRSYFSIMPVLFILILPAISMRSWEVYLRLVVKSGSVMEDDDQLIFL